MLTVLFFCALLVATDAKNIQKDRKLVRPKRWDWISGTVGDLASTITCQSNYVTDQPPTFTNCPPADIVSEYVIDNASGVITWTSPTATANNGNLLSVSQVTGSASGSVFEGSLWGREHTVVYQATDSQGLGESCKFTFTVRVRTCASLPWPDNGRYDCSSGNQTGSTCTFTCDAGYQLSGPSTSTCDGSSWTTTPTCQRLSCGAPSAAMIANADVTCGSATYTYGDTCMISCHVGFKLQGSLYTRCGADGTWATDQTTQCTDDSPPNIYCRTPQIFYADRGLTSTTVTPEVPVATDTVDASPTVTKVSGPVSGATLLIGVYTVQYEAEDSTGKKSPTCDVELRVQALSCGHPLVTMTDTNMDFTCTGYSYGDQCDLDCFRNYPLQGTSLLTCERNDTGATPDGYWSWGSGSKPYCSEEVCPDLDPPRNGELVASSVSGNMARTINCTGNYIIPSMGESLFSGLIVCHSTGWSPDYTSTPGCVNNRTAAVFQYKTEVLYYSGGDCSDPTLLSGFQASFETIVSQVGTQLGALCPADVTCSAINPVAVCNSARRRRSVTKRQSENVDGRARRSASKRQHSLSKRQTGGDTLVLEFDVQVEFDFSGMSVNEMYDYIDNDLQANTIEPGLEAMKDNGDFDMAPWSLQSDSLAVAEAQAYCGSGYLLENWRYCMPCPSGYYLSGKQCLECPVGQYAPVEGAGACTSCPSGYSTRFTASMALDKCIKMCDAGTYSPDTFETCAPCPINYYQNGAGQVSCVKCPAGKTTTSEGSTAESDCQDFDVLLDSVNGDVELAGVTSLSDITLMFWVRAATDSTPNAVIDVNNVVTVSMASNIRVSTPTSSFDESFDPAPSEAWQHVVVSWDTGAGTLSVYMGGQLVSQSAATPPSSPLVQNGHVKVSSDGASGVYLSGLTLRDGVVSDTEVASIAQSCQLPSGSDVINMDVFSELYTAGITVMAPSACDAVDECTSSPCGTHRCYNDAGGGYHCMCYGGWTGSTCVTPPSYCDFSDCINSATCTSGATNYTCGCQSGYSGTLCEEEPVDGGLSAWTTWSECSATCDTGTRSRERSCDSPSADTYGSGCSGQLTETESCNTNTCPVCTPLVTDAGTGYQCTTDVTSGVQSCTIQCTSGYVLSRGLATYTYTCGVDTNYRWEPSNPPSCVVPVIPNNVRLTIEVTYTTTIPSTHENDVKARVSTNLAATDCGTSSSCQIDVTLTGSTLRTESTITLTSYTADPNYGQYVTSGIASTSLQAYIDATSTLESTSSYVTSSVSTVFDVTTSGGTYVVDQTSLTVCVDAQCDSGYVQTNGLCAVCPSGSYQSSDLCVPCALGSYQTQAGYVACTACPTDTTTDAAGATTSSQCAVAASRQDTSTGTTSGNTNNDNDDDSDSNDTDDGSDSDNTLLFTLAAVGPTVVLAAAVIVAACFWYRKRKGTDKVRQPHSPNVPGIMPSKPGPGSGNSNSSFSPNKTNRNPNFGHNVPAVNQQVNGRTASNRPQAQNVQNQISSSRGEYGGGNGDGRGATGLTPPRSGRANRAWEHPKPDGFANEKGQLPTDFGYARSPKAWGTLPPKAPPPYEKGMEAGVDKVQPLQRRGSRDGLLLTVDDLELQAQEYVYIQVGNQRIHDDANGGFNVPRVLSPPPPYRP